MNNNDDNNLRALIRESIAEPPANEWLTLRVVNRLKRRRTASSWLEKTAYGLSACVLVGVAVYICTDQHISISDITLWGATVGTLIALVAGIISDRIANLSEPS